MGNDAEKEGVLAKSKKRNGRHEETRTPDLYRVKKDSVGFSTT